MFKKQKKFTGNILAVRLEISYCIIPPCNIIIITLYIKGLIPSGNFNCLFISILALLSIHFCKVGKWQCSHHRWSLHSWKTASFHLQLCYHSYFLYTKTSCTQLPLPNFLFFPFLQQHGGCAEGCCYWEGLPLWDGFKS